MIVGHHLAGDADGLEAVTRAMVALRASDPASVYLSVLARWMAMRRTLVVFARDDIPTVQAAISTPLAALNANRAAAGESKVQPGDSNPRPPGCDTGSAQAKIAG
jgi:hypothetical protein